MAYDSKALVKVDQRVSNDAFQLATYDATVPGDTLANITGAAVPGYFPQEVIPVGGLLVTVKVVKTSSVDSIATILVNRARRRASSSDAYQNGTKATAYTGETLDIPGNDS